MKKSHVLVLGFFIMILGFAALAMPTVSHAGPGVTIVSPTEGSSVQSTITVQADITGDVQEVSASLRNGTSGKTVFSDKTGAGRYSIVIDTLANRDADNFDSGSYYLSVQARDSSGTLGYDQVVVTLSNSRYVPSARTTSAPAQRAPEPEPAPVVVEETPAPAPTPAAE